MTLGDFISPGLYVKFSTSDRLAERAREIAANVTKLVAVTDIYRFVTAIPYDSEKARSLVGDNKYIPDPEATFDEGKGVCFDKASLMVAMLRAAGIRAKLLIGTLDGRSHAWVSAEAECGWFMCDPTWAGVWDREEMKRHEYIVKYER